MVLTLTPWMDGEHVVMVWMDTLTLTLVTGWIKGSMVWIDGSGNHDPGWMDGWMETLTL